MEKTITMTTWKWEEIQENAEKHRKQEAENRKNIRENEKDLKNFMSSSSAIWKITPEEHREIYRKASIIREKNKLIKKLNN